MMTGHPKYLEVVAERDELRRRLDLALHRCNTSAVLVQDIERAAEYIHADNVKLRRRIEHLEAEIRELKNCTRGPVASSVG